MTKIYNGVPWFDQNENTVNAHGACILKEKDRWYLFGEYKTDDENKYIGFSCYSTADFTNWKFEGLALPPQREGLLGPDRIGERVKVLKCPKTGKFVMLMHTDDLKYCDPCIGLAIGDSIDGVFTFQGPLLYQGKPLKLWDMGTFVDSDETAYLLTHEGNIYRLSEDYTRAEELIAENIAPGGESPACFRAGGKYFLLFSHKTSWERNDNYYFMADNLRGPWEYKGLFCPQGSLTYNSQCSFVFNYDGEKGRVPIYVGDRWSYPRQASAATLILLPIEVGESGMEIPRYLEIWSPDTLDAVSIEPEKSLSFCSDVVGESCAISFHGSRIALFGRTIQEGGYGDIEIYSAGGKTVHKTTVDFYSLVPCEGLRYLSPVMPEGDYTLKVTVSGIGGVWYNKKGDRFGSKGCFVELFGWKTYTNS